MMPGQLPDAQVDDGLVKDRVLVWRVLRAKPCPTCKTMWAPVPSRSVAYAIHGELQDEEPKHLEATDMGAGYLYCCGQQVTWP